MSVATFVRRARAEDIAVPVELQAELFTKVAAYDKNLAARAGDRVRVLIVSKKDDPASVQVAAQMKKALGAINVIGGLPHEETELAFSGAAAVADHCKAQRIAIAFFASGFTDDAATIAKAFDGADLLTVAAAPAAVPKGIVLGCDLVSGKSKLLFNLGQAKKQNVALRPEALKLMKVFE